MTKNGLPDGAPVQLVGVDVRRAGEQRDGVEAERRERDALDRATGSSPSAIRSGCARCSSSSR